MQFATTIGFALAALFALLSNAPTAQAQFAFCPQLLNNTDPAFLVTVPIVARFRSILEETGHDRYTSCEETNLCVRRIQLGLANPADPNVDQVFFPYTSLDKAHYNVSWYFDVIGGWLLAAFTILGFYVGFYEGGQVKNDSNKTPKQWMEERAVYRRKMKWFWAAGTTILGTVGVFLVNFLPDSGRFMIWTHMNNAFWSVQAIYLCITVIGGIGLWVTDKHIAGNPADKDKNIEKEDPELADRLLDTEEVVSSAFLVMIGVLLIWLSLSFETQSRKMYLIIAGMLIIFASTLYDKTLFLLRVLLSTWHSGYSKFDPYSSSLDIWVIYAFYAVAGLLVILSTPFLTSGPEDFPCAFMQVSNVNDKIFVLPFAITVIAFLFTVIVGGLFFRTYNCCGTGTPYEKRQGESVEDGKSGARMAITGGHGYRPV
jgi:hypothetical protein